MGQKTHYHTEKAADKMHNGNDMIYISDLMSKNASGYTQTDAVVSLCFYWYAIKSQCKKVTFILLSQSNVNSNVLVVVYFKQLLPFFLVIF